MTYKYKHSQCGGGGGGGGESPHSDKNSSHTSHFATVFVVYNRARRREINEKRDNKCSTHEKAIWSASDA